MKINQWKQQLGKKILGWEQHPPPRDSCPCSCRCSYLSRPVHAAQSFGPWENFTWQHETFPSPLTPYENNSMITSAAELITKRKCHRVFRCNCFYTDRSILKRLEHSKIQFKFSLLKPLIPIARINCLHIVASTHKINHIFLFAVVDLKQSLAIQPTTALNSATLGLASRVVGLQAYNHRTGNICVLFTVGPSSRWSPKPTLGTNHTKSDVQ